MKKTLKQKIWKLLKTFYWKCISGIDEPWTLFVYEDEPMYLPSFFKIHTPEEAEAIMAEDHKILKAEIEALGAWEKAWKEAEAQSADQTTPDP